ncbi:unnamed protein product [Parnassius apollo]|uniref:(apollo) hypothetical protein n=1 Tax=Parnassius apollo TaxID=110799 RepID=A0A8S3W6S3_PARAO|nr:unnamed protein product [Parnassius apollo]
MLAFTVYVAVAIPENLVHIQEGDENVKLHVNLDEWVNANSYKELDAKDFNQYLLFTRLKPTSSQTLVMDDVDTITSSNYNPNVPTIVVAHGWLGNRHTNLNSVISNAFLENGDNNVIILDWSQVAMSGYFSAIAKIPEVGQNLGKFLSFLNKVTRASFDSMHLVGFSLGSHVVGNAGRELNERIARITGLDLISPIWYLNNNRLNKNDGIYVEVIHTNGVDSTVNMAIGDADFYPNGERSQPGCSSTSCNHNRSWELFAATVTDNHLAGRECYSIQMISSNTCQGKLFEMGNGNINKRGLGLYQLETGSIYPF